MKNGFSDPKNEEKFYDCLDEWERVNPQFLPDHENAQEIYHQLLAGKITPVKISEAVFLEKNKRLNFKFFALTGAIAASVLVAAAFLFRTSLMYACYESGAGQTSTFFLSDSTQVTLNANSCLKVPRFGFGKNEREVDLEGGGGVQSDTQKQQPTVQGFVGIRLSDRSPWNRIYRFFKGAG